MMLSVVEQYIENLEGVLSRAGVSGRELEINNRTDTE